MPQRIDKLLDQLIALRFDKVNEPPDKDLAYQFGDVSQSAFSNYRQGKRRPNAANARIMSAGWAMTLLENTNDLRRLEAQLLQINLHPGGELSVNSVNSLAAVFLRALTEATISEAPSTGDFFPELEQGKIPLRVSLLECGVFSSGKESESKFFNRIFNRFRNQISLPVEIQRQRPFELKDAFERGQIHLALCFFQNVERALWARFYPTPLRVSLGILCNRAHREYIEKIALAIADPSKSHELNRPLQFIVVKNEVGDLYLKQQRFPPVRTRLETLNEAEMADRLVHEWRSSEKIEEERKRQKDRLEVLEAEAKARTLASEEKTELEDLRRYTRQAGLDRVPIPVLVVDEYTALRALKNGCDRGLLLDCVLPLTTLQNMDSAIRREMPIFSMSFACGRISAKFGGWARDSLDTFFRYEVQTTAHAIADLFFELEDEIFEITKYVGQWNNRVGFDPEPSKNTAKRRVLARQYALFALSLTEAAAKVHEKEMWFWVAILDAAREMIRSRWFEESADRTKDFIKHILESGGSNESRRDDLNDYFDPPNPFSLNELRASSPDKVFELAKKKLLNEQEIETDIEVEDVAHDLLGTEVWCNQSHPQIIAARAFLTKLLTLYSQIDLLPHWPASDALEYSKLTPKGLNEAIKKASDKNAEVTRQRIQNTIITGCERYKDPHGSMHLAYELLGGRRQYVGLVCIRRRPGLWSLGGDGHHPRDRFYARVTAEAKDEVSSDDGLVKVTQDEAYKLEYTFDIRYLWVDENYRNRNVAKLLLRWAENHCRQVARKEPDRKWIIQFAVVPELEYAIALAEQMGYKPKPYMTDFDRNDAGGGRLYYKELVNA